MFMHVYVCVCVPMWVCLYVHVYVPVQMNECVCLHTCVHYNICGRHMSKELSGSQFSSALLRQGLVFAAALHPTSF